MAIAQATPEETRPEVLGPDGGEVPTVVPGLTDDVAPVLAPELEPDGGTVQLVPESTLSVYAVDLPLEASVTLASTALFLVVDYLIKPTLEGDISCRRPVGNGRCDPADLSAFDRYSVGRASREWGTFSDIALATSIILPALYLGLESIALPTQAPWRDFADDLLVVGEAMAVTSALQMVLKFAFRRPRPVRYTALEEPLTPFDAELSFPSGHVALVASATTAFTTTVFLRHPTSPARWAVLGAGVILTALTGLARVESGNHFPTDVIVGGFVGSFAGFAVPYLHRKKLPVTPSVSFLPSTGQSTLGIAGSF